MYTVLTIISMRRSSVWEIMCAGRHRRIICPTGVLKDGSVAGFKYFTFTDTREITVEFSGRAEGFLHISHSPEGEIIGSAEILAEGQHQTSRTAIWPRPGIQALYFRFEGSGSLNFHSFTLE